MISCNIIFYNASTKDNVAYSGDLNYFRSKAFFSQWAKIWRMKASKEFQQMLLSMDFHAPAKLRANIPPTNLEEFYDTFDVKETDKMYRAPENRLKIW
ncbi:M13-type metalloendopeptidase [Lactococcus lactis]|uniref:M13-type metalloendopeptidase n=1 Tax=Lactococcus lactis TaxID=1358 RepID=UPI0022E5854F|nr:M13-type metalloendopeptidase [Lactococcus lactis]MDA2886713.1 hypothetical protein [Lactococcus lactis]